ncbi:MAG: polymer-forming cytoskeletal protein [Spirochaetaceae bacterium]|jgi:cytoskeletal protein CcmA (bactofilin family)|nr:polymer-forming cytoskeletal protein [Spirochaetaceae bacterium]
MSEIKAHELEDSDFSTILSKDIEFKGNLKFGRPFLIRGQVSGKIEAENLLVVDEDAVVNADIIAKRVVVKGRVKGNVTGREKVEITLTGKLDGNVKTPEIFLETGCIFNGRCEMTQTEVK